MLGLMGDNKPKPSLRAQIVRPLIVVGVLLAVLFAWNLIRENQRQDRIDQQVTDSYCQQFGQDDPDCP